jgi:hypothetical protein
MKSIRSEFRDRRPRLSGRGKLDGNSNLHGKAVSSSIAQRQFARFTL